MFFRSVDRRAAGHCAGEIRVIPPYFRLILV